MKWPTASLFVNGVRNGKHWALTRDSGYTAQKSRGLSGLIRGENGHPAQNAKKVNNGRGGRVLAKFYGEICGQTYSALAVLHFIKTPAWFHASPSVIAIYPEDNAPFQNVLLKPSAEGNHHEFIHSQKEVSSLMELAECQVVKTADDWAEIIIFPFFFCQRFRRGDCKTDDRQKLWALVSREKTEKIFPRFRRSNLIHSGRGRGGNFPHFHGLGKLEKDGFEPRISIWTPTSSLRFGQFPRHLPSFLIFNLLLFFLSKTIFLGL